ncbi:MAG: hypothetical protein ABI868_05840 [Acidobacteriota bacterium]
MVDIVFPFRKMSTKADQGHSLVNYLSPQTTTEDMLVDESASATVRDLGQNLTALEVEGHIFGSCSLTVVAYDRDAMRLDRSVAECLKVFAGHDGALCEESYNLLNAWLAIVPGNASHNVRRLALLNTNAADLSSCSRAIRDSGPAFTWWIASVWRSSKRNTRRRTSGTCIIRMSATR